MNKVIQRSFRNFQK